MIAKSMVVKLRSNERLQHQCKRLLHDCLCTELKARQLTVKELLGKEVEVTIMLNFREGEK